MKTYKTQPRCPQCKDNIGDPFSIDTKGEIDDTLRHIGNKSHCPGCGEEVYPVMIFEKKPRFNKTKMFLVLLTAFFVFAGVSHVLGWWNVYEWFGYPRPYNK